VTQLAILGPHQALLENLLLGAAGSVNTISSSLFHKADERVADLKAHDLGTLERAFTVSIDAAESLELGGVYITNRTTSLDRHTVTVAVGYVVTGQEGADFELLGEESGGASLTLVQNRASTDYHLIRACLCHYQNFGGQDPHIIDIRPIGKPGLSTAGDRAILTITFDMWVRSTVPGTYGPST